MKGLVFTEFIEMVEEKFGFEISNSIIENAKLNSGGIYTAVGTYPFSEMVSLVTELHKTTNIAVEDLLKTFGHHLFERFSRLYPHFFKAKKNTFEFLMNIEGYIHVEVLKLYPDAELPKIDARLTGDNKMEMLYSSSRKLSLLAEGLMEGCMEYFNENIAIEKENIDSDGSKVKFYLTRID